MYKSVSVENFRGFESLELEGFQRANLVTGQNNVGKTAFLEALFVHSGAYNPELIGAVNGIRGIANLNIDLVREHESPWDSVFYNYNSNKPIKIDADIDDEGWQVRISYVTSQAEISGLSFAVQKTYDRAIAQSTRIAAKILKLEFHWHKKRARTYYLILDASGKKIEPPLPAPPFPSRFHYGLQRVPPKEDAQRFARVQIDGSEEFILNAMRTLEPRLKRLGVAVEASEPMIHGDIGIKGRGIIPLALMGDGLNRLCSILLLIASVPKGLLIIDEIDAGLHFSALRSVWKQIYAALDLYDVQLFCTSHSLECVSAAHEAALGLKEKGEKYPLKVFRLERGKSGVAGIDYDENSLATSLKNNFEVR